MPYEKKLTVKEEWISAKSPLCTPCLSLGTQGADVKHILKDKSCIDNTVLENLLLEKYAKKLPQKDLFNPPIGEKERLEKAYQLKSKNIAYKPFQQS